MIVRPINHAEQRQALLGLALRGASQTRSQTRS